MKKDDFSVLDLNNVKVTSGAGGVGYKFTRKVPLDQIHVCTPEEWEALNKEDEDDDGG